MASSAVHMGVRVLMGIVAVALLLVPSILMLIAWTEVNLMVTLAALLVLIMVARRFPSWKWPATVAVALLVAVPPYPYWVFASNDRGWYFHFFSGYDLSTLPLATFVGVFIAATALCTMLSWSLDPESFRKP